MRASGQEPWLLGISGEGRLIAGCYGFLSSGLLNRALTLPCLPKMEDYTAFWRGLVEFCDSQQVTHLILGNSAPNGTAIPSLPGEISRQHWTEYVMSLDDPKWEARIARKHRQNIVRAERAGVQLRRSQESSACRDHVLLMAASLERRQRRGETVRENLEDEMAWSLLAIENHAAQLFQAVLGDRPLSSALILLASEGAFNRSAGTSAEGMQCGASHFLMRGIAASLRQESVKMFNLGGVVEDAGLSLFKSRFGAIPVLLEEAEFYRGGRTRRMLTVARDKLRKAGFRRLLLSGE